MIYEDENMTIYVLKWLILRKCAFNGLNFYLTLFLSDVLNILIDKSCLDNIYMKHMIMYS